MQCPRCKKTIDAQKDDCPYCGVSVSRWLAKDDRPLLPALPDWLRFKNDDQKRIAIMAAGAIGLVILVGVFWGFHKDGAKTSDGKAPADLQEMLQRNGRTIQGLPPSMNDSDLIHLVNGCQKFMGDQNTTLPNGFDARLFSDAFDNYPFLSQAVGGGLVAFDPPLEPDQTDAGPYKWIDVRFTPEGSHTLQVTEPPRAYYNPAVATSTGPAPGTFKNVHVPMRLMQRMGGSIMWDDSETFRIPFWWTFGDPNQRDGFAHPLLLGTARIVGKDPSWRVDAVTVNLGGRETTVRCSP